MSRNCCEKIFYKWTLWSGEWQIVDVRFSTQMDNMTLTCAFEKGKVRCWVELGPGVLFLSWLAGSKKESPKGKLKTSIIVCSSAFLRSLFFSLFPWNQKYMVNLFPASLFFIFFYFYFFSFFVSFLYVAVIEYWPC